MKTMKIKSYSFKKNSVLNKETKGSDTNKNSNFISANTANTTKPHIEYSSINNNVLSDVEKILKSPGLNISLTKTDDKGNVKFISKSSKMSESIFDKIGVSSENKINIKLNINSEVINNNIRINQNKSLKKKNSSEGITPNTSQEKNEIDYNYYKGLVKEKDKQIEILKNELNKAKLFINKLKHNCNNSIDVVENEVERCNSENKKINLINPNERKNILTLNLSKKLNLKNSEISSEIFSDRPTKNNHNTNNFLKTFSLNKNYNITSNNLSSFFRNNNKIVSSTTKLNDTSKIIIFYFLNLETVINNLSNANICSPVKPKDSRPIEEILKTTIKLIEKNKIKEETSSKIITNSKDVNENLKMLKTRTQKILNNYSEMIISFPSKVKHQISNSGSNFHNINLSIK